MSVTALPNQNAIIAPIEWQGQTHKTTMQAAGYMLSGTVGWRPYSEAATIQWVLDAGDAQTMLNAFKAVNFNGVYSYNCNIRGTINVRLSGDFALQERRTGQKALVSVGVYTV